METENLILVPETPDHVRFARLGSEAYLNRFGLRLAEGLSDYARAATPEWLARLASSRKPASWPLAFAITLKGEPVVIGMCGYKTPPDDQAVVEIAYGIAPAYQGRGYATEAARALILYAIDSRKVTRVRAHTLPQHNASAKVLTKCGLTCLGEVIDPEDGRVWRWEKACH